MIIGDILTSIFGTKGLTGGIVDVLKTTGIIKDPESLLKAEEALRGYELSLKDKDIEIEKINVQDRDSARKREIEVKDKTNRNIAYITILGFFALLGILFYVTIPETAKNIISILIGYLGANVQAIYNYYFGSSSGSADKNNTINKILEGIK